MTGLNVNDALDSPQQFWHALSVSEAARALDVAPAAGLSAGEAEKRLEEWGPNRLPEAAGQSVLRRLLEQFTQFLVIVLLAAAAISLILGETVDAAAILTIVVLNGVLGFIQEYRAEQALQALRSLAAPTATVFRDGQPLRLRADLVVPGDLLQLEDGDVVPADARLVEVTALRLNEAILTGESAPVDKIVDPLAKETNLAERRCIVYQGGLVVHGRGVALVVATGERTEMGRIAASIGRQPDVSTPLQRRLAQMGRWLVYASGALCAAVFVIGVLSGIAVDEMLLTTASLAVAAIPEGLPAATTIVLALGVQRMARRSVIVRRLAAVETLGSVTIVCVDKTGTLTQNRMEAQELWVDGAFVTVEGLKALDGNDETLRQALLAAVLCNDAALPQEGGDGVGDPTEVALLTLANRLGLSPDDSRQQAPRELEVPFDAERSRMTVVCRTPAGRVAYTKGAPEVVVPLATATMDRARQRPLEEGDRRRMLEAAVEMAARGMRVLALAQRAAPDAGSAEELEHDLTLLALVGLADPLRPEARPAVEQAVTAGIRPVMITGDHPVTARAIAEGLGLPTDHILVGRDVEGLPDDELERAVAQTSIFARVASQHKLRIVNAFRRLGQIVAMTGDGVNDAPALHAADIGIAMGQGGTDVAREASDMVLMDNNFRSIVAAVREGRTIYDNIRKFIHYLLTCNLAEVMVVFVVIIASGDTPLLPVQILFINLLTDGLPALALGMEPAEAGLMRRPPRSPQAGILTFRSLVPLLGVGALVAGPTLAAYAWGHTAESEDVGRQMAFATLVGTQLAAAFVFRSPARSVVRLRRNWWLVGAVVLSVLLLLAVFYAPFLQPAFRTEESLSSREWLGVAGLSLVPLAAVEAVKLSWLLLRPGAREG